MSDVLFYGIGVESGRRRVETADTPHTPSERSTKLSQSQRWFEKEVRTGPATGAI
jgi:hypothetical protein